MRAVAVITKTKLLYEPAFWSELARIQLEQSEMMENVGDALARNNEEDLQTNLVHLLQYAGANAEKLAQFNTAFLEFTEAVLGE